MEAELEQKQAALVLPLDHAIDRIKALKEAQIDLQPLLPFFLPSELTEKSRRKMMEQMKLSKLLFLKRNSPKTV